MNSQATSSVLVENAEAAIAVVRLNRPARANAMDMDSVARLQEVVELLSRDAAVRVVILTGQGKAFCAGLDLKSVTDATGELCLDSSTSYQLQERFADTVHRLRASDKVIIAAVNGAAVGFGCALTLAADIRLASSAASFHNGAIRIGLSAGECGISYHLPRLVGASRAFELMLTGRAVQAEEAERIGLVARVVPPPELVGAALACARDVARNSPFATRHTKRLMWANLDAPSLQAALELENRTQLLGLQNGDFSAAVRSLVRGQV